MFISVCYNILFILHSTIEAGDTESIFKLIKPMANGHDHAMAKPNYEQIQKTKHNIEYWATQITYEIEGVGSQMLLTGPSILLVVHKCIHSMVALNFVDMRNVRAWHINFNYMFCNVTNIIKQTISFIKHLLKDF